MPLDYVPLPLGGLDDRDSFAIDKDSAPNLRNVRTHRERIERAPGGVTFAAAPVLASSFGVRTGTFAKATATGNQTITHTLGATPVALILWTEGSVSNATLGNDFYQAIGFTDGTSSRSASISSEDDVPTSNTARARSATLLRVVKYDAVTLEEAAFVSWSSTNFVVNWTTSSSSARRIHYMLIGGVGVTANVASNNITANGAVNHPHGLGTTPTVLFLLDGGPGTTTPQNQAGAYLSWGFVDGSLNQFSLGAYSEDAVGTTVTRRGYSTAHGYHFADPTRFETGEVTVLDATNIRIQTSTFLSSHTLFSLAIAGISAKVGNFNSTTAATPANQTVTGVGFKPQGLMVLGNAAGGSGLGAQINEDLHYQIGAADGSTQSSTAIADFDARNTSTVEQYTTTSGIIRNTRLTRQARLTSMNADGFTLNWTANGLSAVMQGYVALRFIAATDAGTPRNLAQAWFSGTTEKLAMLTNTRAYIWSGTAWTDSDGVYAGVSATQRFAVANAQNRLAYSARGFTVGGAHQVRSYDGTTFSNLVAQSDGGTKYSANIVLGFNDRIVIADISQAGTVFPARVRWGASTDITDFRTTTRGAGFLDIIEHSNAPLTGGFVHGERAFLAKQRQLLELVATGQGAVVHRQQKIADVGILARHSVAHGDYFTFWLGPDDVYQWDGQTLKPIGEKMYNTIISLIDYNNTDVVQGMMHTTDSEYHLLIPPDRFIYDYRRERWFRDVDRDTQAMATWRAGTNITIDLNASEAIFIADTERVVYRLDPLLTTFDGDPMDSYVETKDLFAQEAIPTRNGMVYQPTLVSLNSVLRVLVKTVPDGVVEIGYSTDKGSTWNTFEATANSGGMVEAFPLGGGGHEFQHIRFRYRSQVGGMGAFQVMGTGAYEWAEAGVNLPA